MILNRDVYCILGLPFDVVNLNEAVSIVNTGVGSRTACFLSTPNLNFIIAAMSDDAFFQSVLESDLSVADGMPIIWVAKLLGIPLKERVAGSTLFNALSTTTREQKIKVFFFGGQAGIAELAHKRLNRSSLGMTCCGFYDPGFVSVDEMSSTETIDCINQSEPDFVVVALGAKKGQEWIQRNQKSLSASVISHLGAVINFVAGSVDRAPEFWQKAGLEWLWRIKQEPNLWRRYFFDGLGLMKLLIIYVFPLALHNWIAKKMSYYSMQPKIVIDNQDTTVLTLSGSFRHEVLVGLKARLGLVLGDYNKDVVINCVNLEYVDSACIATLLLFQSELNKKQRELSLEQVPRRIKLVMKFNHVFKRFSYKY
jgi:N-acetylglucosaminyldiphosphoundecaprenol N-acetyl-beta-D-mannosaminyltransferase